MIVDNSRDIDCSNCGLPIWAEFTFCPHCGARQQNILKSFVMKDAVKIPLEDVIKSNKHMEEVRRECLQKLAASEISAGEIWLD